MVVSFAVHMNRKAQVLTGCKKVELFLQQKSIGTQIDVLLPSHEPLDDFLDLRVHQRLAAGDGDSRSTAFLNRPEALLRGELSFQDMRGILNLAASRAGQVTAEKRLEHEDQRIAFTPGKP